jgi:hypothetical protein
MSTTSLLVQGLSVNGDPRSGEGPQAISTSALIMAPAGPIRQARSTAPSPLAPPSPAPSQVSLAFQHHGPGFPPAKLSLRIISFHFTPHCSSSSVPWRLFVPPYPDRQPSP